MFLNGKWKLYFAPTDEDNIPKVDTLDSSGYSLIEATVPGNVELDLINAGLLPEDIFRGLKLREAEQFETYDWWYEKTFTAPEAIVCDEKAILHFRGVDCIAEYYLNGEKLGDSDNMFIAHEFDVTGRLLFGKENTLTVHISSIATVIDNGDRETYNIDAEWSIPKLLVGIRKAPHMSGWDIMPRAISAGLWRDVELKIEKKYGIKYLYVNAESVGTSGAKCRVTYETDLPLKYRLADLKVKITAVCGDQVITAEALRKGCTGSTYFEMPNCKLWWPKPLGEPNMYDITLGLYTLSGELLCEKTVRRGIRKVKLNRTETVCENGRFQFEVNGKKVLALGTNWVPMDPFHSRDKSRLGPALEMAEDLGCNIIRCWGGNVYEDHEFFDFCDEHGIMVWQDFAMACQRYPQTEKFFDKIRREAEWVVREYRGHPSIVVWSGDNEIDAGMVAFGYAPSTNAITREVLPSVIKRLDPEREYLPSSPYISDAAYNMGDNRQGSKFYPEDHLWGPRNYFKSDFYKNSGAYFVSEIGYHGCPSRKSIEKFIDSEYVNYYFGNPQWVFHSSDQFERPDRAQLMSEQIKHLFGEVPEDLDEFVFASQAVQAEAKKFFIEHTRMKMNKMGGMIWWNLIDGWPQFSDAIVDYYYDKKLAYDFIKRSQQPIIIMIDEMTPWGGQPVLCTNSTYCAVSGHLRITDIESDKVVLEKDFSAAPFSAAPLGKLDVLYSEQGMFKIEWTLDDGTEGKNHYLYGQPGFSLSDYKKWFSKI